MSRLAEITPLIGNTIGRDRASEKVSPMGETLAGRQT